MTTVAVIQPYFFPYGGYFRLFAAADVVVMFDCVQFPRRGWVHRNRFPLANGELDWLTLPLAKGDRDLRIAELQWAAGARERLSVELRRFPALDRARENALVRRMLDVEKGDVATYLCERVEDVVRALRLEKPMVRSTTLTIDPDLRAQERVIAIVKALGGHRYVNPSGGRALYDHDAFEREGLELRFLTPYGGSTESVLTRLLCEETRALADEILRETNTAA